MTKDAASQSDKITLQKHGRLNLITLDRAAALNALDIDMVMRLHEILGESLADDGIASVMIVGAGDRAYCAGGDIKAARLGAVSLRENGNDLGILNFFAQEYELNKKIFHYPKPLIAFMDGITMGGGVGLSAPARYKIATPKTVWAMPEVTIGFFPDIGAGYYLTRAPGYAGYYLGLTGASLRNPADMLNCGFATHFSEKKREDWISALAGCNGHDDVKTALEKLSVKPVQPVHLPYDTIADCFNAASVEAILTNLEAKGQWARDTALLIRSKSPTSLKVTLRHLQLSEKEGFDAIMARDIKLAEKFLQKGDMVEGIRSVVVDKDHTPKWQPDRLEAIDPAGLDWYFS